MIGEDARRGAFGMTTWVVRVWRRLRGRCPACGGGLQLVVFAYGSGDACLACPWWRDDDGDEHWPKVTGGGTWRSRSR